MEKIYPVFTVEAGKVTKGTEVVPFELSNGTLIWAITVGERGRGRHLGVLPVAAAAPLGAGAKPWRLFRARIGRTVAGRPKLIAANLTEAATDAAIFVLKTPIGYRGSNRHTVVGVEETPIVRHPDVLKILAEGVIAQGEAGRMGAGDQYIALIKRGVWIKTSYTGRLYGKPAAHVYRFDGENVEALSEEELGLND